MIKNLIKNIILNILTWEAKMVIGKFKPFVIGVTGNLGKTTTKDTIASSLKSLNIRESKKSFNSEWGVPITILGLSSGGNNFLKWLKVLYDGLNIYFGDKYPEYLILEIGADKKGDIESVGKWLKFDMGVITQFADVPVHIENFKDKNELIREKKYLADNIIKGGIFIYNSDCEDSIKIKNELSKEREDIKMYSFGVRSGNINAPIIISDIDKKNVTAQVFYKDNNYKLECSGVIGDSPIICALPSIIISDLLGLDIETCIKNIKNMHRSPGRMRVLEGKFGSVIVDDSYNASPLATAHGLNTMFDAKCKGRKIAVLGDMLELGEFSMREHYKVGGIAAKTVDVLVTVGTRARSIVEGALDAGMGEGWVLECNDSSEAAREVLNILKDGDVVYVKGSQSMRMERVTKELVTHNVSASDMPRQEKEWLNKK